MFNTTTDPDTDEAIYTADDISEDKRCSHVFYRVSPNRVECKMCHAGYMDSPNSPFPIDELNEFYKEPKNQEYYKWM
jgi:hypothetical protein